MGYNKTILEGHLTRDIEMKYTQAGAAIANTAIAVSRKFKTQTGEQKEEVLFIDLAFHGRTAEIANQFLRKGSHVLIDGRLKLDQWIAQDGAKRSKHGLTVENLQMLGSKEGQPGQQPARAPQSTYGAPTSAPTTAPAYNPPTPGQTAPNPNPAGDPAYNHAPTPAPAYNPTNPAAGQPQPGQQPAGQSQQPRYQLQPGQEPGPGQYEVGRAPNGAPIVMNEDEIPF